MNSNMAIGVNNLEILFRKAISIKDLANRYHLITNIYKQKGYLQGVQTIELNHSLEELILHDLACFEGIINPLYYQDYLKNGVLIKCTDSNEVYFDKYHQSSIPFLAKSGEKSVGSARLIVSDLIGLPTLTDPTIIIYDDFKWVSQIECLEFSQFAVKAGTFTHVSVGILKITYIYSKTKLKIHNWIAMIDNNVLKFLNSNYFNFNFSIIGPSIDYLGSLCTPVYINIDNALDNSAKYESSKPVADYIRDIDCSSFENNIIEY